MRSLLLVVTVVLSTALAAPGLAAADQHEAQLIEMERALWEAWKNADSAPFEQSLAGDATLILGDGAIYAKAQAVETIGSGSCKVAGYELSDFKVRSLGPEAASLVYNASQDAVCDGEPIPPKLVVSSTWAMSGGNWQNVLYQETVVHAHE